MEAVTLDQLLSDSARAFVDQRVREGAYANAGEYLSDLVRRDHEQQATKRLRELIEEGLASGPPTPLTDDELAAIRARVFSAGR